MQRNASFRNGYRSGFVPQPNHTMGQIGGLYVAIGRCNQEMLMGLGLPKGSLMSNFEIRTETE